MSNGIRVITERHPYTEAICAGFWFCTGSRDETLSQKGISHFLEHLVFKGTKKRTAFQLAKAMESRGGELNAYTSRENICFYATSLGKDLNLNLDLLTDLSFRATFPEKDFSNEKDVILQEIAMYFDNSEEYIFDAFSEEVYKNHPMGWPILGTEGSLRALSRKRVMSYYKETFSPEKLIVSVVGNVDHKKVVEFVELNLGHLKRKKQISRRLKPKFHRVRKHIPRTIEQCHILVGFDSPGLKNPLRFASYIVNTALGGGMTSLLYQKIRERKGLAYTIYSTGLSSIDSGMTLIYAAADSDKRDEVIKLIMNELKNFKKTAMSKSTLEKYKTQIRGFLTLNDDDLESRMNAICLNEQVFGSYRSLQDLLDAIERVQVTDIKKFLKKYIDTDKISILTLGPQEKKR